ncbi:hypothetical protein NHX12_005031 [Muraenolepis orangiensis]|uniref:Secreted protein n=1 Tax=Muraenolepis orangiensis TaxID=630683 RepID=A0A9Q0DY99_9TELE|nr:hypothetical protein NHX12_005031 [Muraenolepis orangiensis]
MILRAFVSLFAVFVLCSPGVRWVGTPEEYRTSSGEFLRCNGKFGGLFSPREERSSGGAPPRLRVPWELSVSCCGSPPPPAPPRRGVVVLVRGTGAPRGHHADMLTV